MRKVMLTGKMPSERRKAYNIREDKELGQKVIVQKNTWHFPRLPRPSTLTGTGQIFQRKIWGRPSGQIMLTALFGFIVAVVFFVSGAPLVFAARGGEKGASPQAYEHASENAIFNRIGDWFATVGKTGEEKERILKERKAERARRRAERKTIGDKEQAEQEAERLQEKEREREREREKELERVKEGVGQQKGFGRGAAKTKGK